MVSQSPTVAAVDEPIVHPRIKVVRSHRGGRRRRRRLQNRRRRFAAHFRQMQIQPVCADCQIEFVIDFEKPWTWPRLMMRETGPTLVCLDCIDSGRAANTLRPRCPVCHRQMVPNGGYAESPIACKHPDGRTILICGECVHRATAHQR